MGSRCALVIGVFLSFSLVLGLGYWVKREQMVVQGEVFSSVILIDAGHGGEDGGAVGVSGEIESQINLAIALKLEQLLLLYGFEPVLLREEDISLHEDSAESISEKKSSDLKQRVSLINSYEDGILLSIHQNSFTDGKYYGAQVFYSENAQDLGEHMQTALREGLDPSNERVSKLVDSGLYLMNRVEMPALLVECGFLSHHHEALLLGTSAYQQKIACVLVAGLLTRDKEFT